MTTRDWTIGLRLTDAELRRIDRAAALSGQSASSFIVTAAIEKVDQVFAETAVTTVPADYFDRLLASIDEAEKPLRLARAAKRIGPRRIR